MTSVDQAGIHQTGVDPIGIDEAGMDEADSRPTALDLPVRLTLLDPDPGPRWIDGVWWPRCHDLGRGLPGLLTALEERWPGITRVTVSRPMWRARPAIVRWHGRVVHIKRSAVTARPHTICLLSYGIGRCDLLVLPPGLHTPDALRAMREVPVFGAM